MPENKKNHPQADNLPHLDNLNASSAMDCTGLIPSNPQSQDEIESYQEIYNFRPDANKKP